MNTSSFITAAEIINSTISPTVSILVALVTVSSTLYLQEKRSTVRSLLALRAEAESNREITADALLKLSLDVAHDEPGNLTPAKISTASYAMARNNGAVSKMSEESRKLLNEHYTKIATVNSEIGKIDNLWVEQNTLDSKEEYLQQTLLATEQRTLEMLLMLFDDMENDRIEDMDDYLLKTKENLIGYFDFSYSNTIDKIEDEIERIRFSFLFK